ncbi:hypothetical protein LSH36_3024g00002 [Paralvinella palmiformis]|uniref:Fork-head domain-containing protein n=1 Tax=Paralvinella palmiformis TaxID=53620 RepID=A0AAD9IR12_9ANNE|nr:hypothetical protein LSH36_3024g00002 [Paralvinella palmiformis]
MAYNSFTAVREHLSVQLRRNWLSAYGTESPSVDLDDSLTDLDWLINLGTKVEKSTKTPSIMYTEDRTDNIEQRTPMTKSVQVDADYKTCSQKPPHSYAKLITMAIMESERKMLVLSDIYKWITDNYMYYMNTSSNWQNSVRHNLSMNRNFQKVSRKDGDTSKGRFWKISSDVNDSFRENFSLCENRKRNFETLSKKLSPSVNDKKMKIEKENRRSSEDVDILSTAVNMSDIYSFTDLQCKAEVIDRNIISDEPQVKRINTCERTSPVKRCETKRQQANVRSLLKIDSHNPSQLIGSCLKIIDNWNTTGKENATTCTLEKDENDKSNDKKSFSILDPECTKPLNDVDFLLSDYDPNFKSSLDLTTDLPLDLTTFDKDIIEETVWNECYKDNKNVTSLDNESRMSTPTELSENEECSVWNADLMMGDTLTDYFEKDINDIFNTMPVFPRQHYQESNFKSEIIMC